MRPDAFFVSSNALCLVLVLVVVIVGGGAVVLAVFVDVDDHLVVGVFGVSVLLHLRGLFLSLLLCRWLWLLLL